MSRNRTHKTNGTDEPQATGASAAPAIASDSACARLCPRTLSVVVNTYSEAGGEALAEWHVCGDADTIQRDLAAELSGVAARFAERYAAELRATCPAK